jgi:hypothetical protein
VGDDGASDAGGEPLVTIREQDSAEFLLGVTVHDVGSRPWIGEIHAHVEWGVMTVRKSTLDTVELGGRNSEVEEGTTQRCDICFLHSELKAVETAVNSLKPIPKTSEPFGCCVESRLIAINTQNSQVRVRIEEHLCVSAAAKRGIEYHSCRNRGEQPHDLARHDRQVMKESRTSCGCRCSCDFIVG